jgi:hypothetical protein
MRNPEPKSSYQPICEGQVTGCFPPSELMCVHDTFNPETCERDYPSPWCKDSIGACAVTTGCYTPTSPTPTAPALAPVASPPTYTEKCFPNNGLRAYDNCEKHYQCWNGVAYNEVSCGRDNLLFDSKLRLCNWKVNVKTCEV